MSCGLAIPSPKAAGAVLGSFQPVAMFPARQMMQPSLPEGKEDNAARGAVMALKTDACYTRML